MWSLDFCFYFLFQLLVDLVHGVNGQNVLHLVVLVLNREQELV